MLQSYNDVKIKELKKSKKEQKKAKESTMTK